MTKRQSELFSELPSYNKYVSDYPELVAEWHPSKNGNLLPDKFHVGSHEKVWWECSKGYEWLTELGCELAGVQAVQNVQELWLLLIARHIWS